MLIKIRKTYDDLIRTLKPDEQTSPKLLSNVIVPVAVVEDFTKAATRADPLAWKYVSNAIVAGAVGVDLVFIGPASEGYWDIWITLSTDTALAQARTAGIQLRISGLIVAEHRWAQSPTIGAVVQFFFARVWMGTNWVVALNAIEGYAAGETVQASIVLRAA